MASIADCCCPKKPKQTPRSKEQAILASETAFTVNEIEALYDLFERISSSVFDDGLIHREQFQLALFGNSSKKSILADRLFDVIDIKNNGAIEFGDFVRSVSVFHPNAPEADKVEFIFRLYDLRRTGYIERGGLKEMILALLSEMDLTLADDEVEAILNKTILDADSKGDGRIDLEEWKEFIARNPDLLKNMTIPCLREITQAFPDFVVNTQVRDLERVL